VIAIETRAGGLTVSIVEPLTIPELAVMVVEPCALLVASPVVPTVATLVFEDAHIAELVRF